MCNSTNVVLRLDESETSSNEMEKRPFQGPKNSRIVCVSASGVNRAQPAGSTSSESSCIEVGFGAAVATASFGANFRVIVTPSAADSTRAAATGTFNSPNFSD